jgi:hypothetical protein
MILRFRVVCWGGWFHVSTNISALVKLARALHVPLDEILGDAGAPGPRNGRVKDHTLLRRLEKIEKLSKRQKQALFVTLDNFLKGAGVS